MSISNASPAPVSRELAANTASPMSNGDDESATAAASPVPETTGPRQSPGKTSPDLNTTGPHQRE